MALTSLSTSTKVWEGNRMATVLAIIIFIVKDAIIIFIVKVAIIIITASGLYSNFCPIFGH